MHVVKPVAWSQTKPQMGTFAFSSANASNHRLLRMTGTFPAVYGVVTYVDPYLDFVSVDVLASDGTQSSWAGTHQQCDDTWEPFLIQGAT
jgi:hypothetical protein